jgi:membrane associated rhomboid family serine protease
MVYSIYGMQKPFGNIGHSAHFGGAISGLLTIMLLSPWVALRYPLIMALMILPVLYAVYLFRKRN